MYRCLDCKQVRDTISRFGACHNCGSHNYSLFNKEEIDEWYGLKYRQLIEDQIKFLKEMKNDNK